MSCCQSPSEEAANYYREREEDRKQKIKELGGVDNYSVIQEKDSNEIMQDYLDEMKFHCMEGSSGVLAINKICSDLGYKDEGFRNGSSIETMLADNSDLVMTILEWITEHLDKIPEWKKALTFEENPPNDSKETNISE